MTCGNCGSIMPEDARFCGECGRLFAATAATAVIPVATARMTEAPDPAFDPAFDTDNTANFAPPDLEQTIIVGAARRGSLSIRFSTGESVVIIGAGLIGRHPVPEPTEYFDQLVTISDASKSVSKTHLEFGLTGGSLWVLDRRSGNGTSITEPGAEERDCEPGKRYRAPHGSRVMMGEQFFDVEKG